MEIESKLSLVLYSKSWEKLIEKGLLKTSDYVFYQQNVGDNRLSLVDVRKRILVASSTNAWDVRNANYLNEDYFIDDPENFEVIDVVGMANFPDTILMCRMREDENRIWTKTGENKYKVNFDFFPDDKSRQASIIEILSDMENPIVIPDIKATISTDSLKSLLESLDFQSQIDEIMNKK